MNSTDHSSLTPSERARDIDTGVSRVGFAIAHEPVAAALRKTAVPFGVSQLAQDAAVASLRAEDELLGRVGSLVCERTRVVDALRDQGWTVPDTQANFVWVRAPGLSGDALAQALRRQGVIVAPGGPLGADDHVRAAVLDEAATTRLLRAYENAVSGSATA